MLSNPRFFNIHSFQKERQRLNLLEASSFVKFQRWLVLRCLMTVREWWRILEWGFWQIVTRNIVEMTFVGLTQSSLPYTSFGEECISLWTWFSWRKIRLPRTSYCYLLTMIIHSCWKYIIWLDILLSDASTSIHRTCFNHTNWKSFTQDVMSYGYVFSCCTNDFNYGKLSFQILINERNVFYLHCFQTWWGKIPILSNDIVLFCNLLESFASE